MTDLTMYHTFKLYLQAKMKRLILLSIAVATTYLAHAQHVCGSDLHHQNISKKHPELRILEQNRPAEVAEFQKNYKYINK